MHRHLIPFVLTLVVISACKKEQPTPIADPCVASSEVTADFRLMEGLAGAEYGPESDTMYTYNTARFKAEETGAHYQWYINGEYVSNEASDYKYFGDEYDWQTIPVTLIVTKQPDTACHPDDDGADTVVKMLTLVPRTDHIRAEGIFRVKADFMTDSIDVVVDYQSCGDGPMGTCLTITNYDGAGSVIHDLTSFLYYRQISFADLHATKEIYGYVKVPAGKPAEIYTRIWAEGFPTQEIRSFGRKL